MARNDTIALPATTWTQLTNANATAVRIQNRSEFTIELMATNGTTAPTDHDGSLTLAPHETLAADLTLADLWPGVAGANRLWAHSHKAGLLSVSHADA